MADIFKNVSHVPWSVLCAAVFYLFIALFIAASVVKYARKVILSFIVSTISRRRIKASGTSALRYRRMHSSHFSHDIRPACSNFILVKPLSDHDEDLLTALDRFHLDGTVCRIEFDP